MTEPSNHRTVTVRNKQGLHMRPADLLVKAAMRFESRIEIEKDGQVVDGKSILGLLTLGAQCGSTLQVRAHGKDADHAIGAVVELFEKGFFEVDQEAEHA